jgi:hypothetical protein
MYTKGQMAVKYANTFDCKTPKIYPTWDFWSENKPSGNPAHRPFKDALQPSSF